MHRHRSTHNYVSSPFHTNNGSNKEEPSVGNPKSATPPPPAPSSFKRIARNTMKVGRAFVVNVDHRGGDEKGFEAMTLSFPDQEFTNPNALFAAATGVQKIISSDQNRKYAAVLEHITAPYIAGPLYYRYSDGAPEDAQACFSETLRTDEKLIHTAVRGLSEEAGFRPKHKAVGEGGALFPSSFNMKDCPLKWQQHFQQGVIHHYPVILHAKELEPCCSSSRSASTAATAAPGGSEDDESASSDAEPKDSEDHGSSSTAPTAAIVDIKRRKVDIFIQGTLEELVALAQSERLLAANNDVVPCSSQTWFIGGLVIFDVNRLKRLVYRAMTTENSAPLSKGIRVGGPPPAFGSKTVPERRSRRRQSSSRQDVGITESSPSETSPSPPTKKSPSVYQPGAFSGLRKKSEE